MYQTDDHTIDRKIENKEVTEYQKTKNTELLEKIITRRMPTLAVWAQQHYDNKIARVIDSKDDLTHELIVPLHNAIKKYDIKKGSFNSQLYTYLLNYIRNIAHKAASKKRDAITYSLNKQVGNHTHDTIQEFVDNIEAKPHINYDSADLKKLINEILELLPIREKKDLEKYLYKVAHGEVYYKLDQKIHYSISNYRSRMKVDRAQKFNQLIDKY